MSSNPSQSTRESRQSIHPLLLYDPGILKGGIQLLKLEYLESEKTKAPVPRNQEVPKSAFGTLTGRSVLVATSHAWFHQCHPDPHGVKLRIMRKEFFPRLRKRFPYTQILIFDDWHSCPQWPRTTKEEQDRFQKCMDHMNTVYCYCDVVLFVEARLPDLDNTVFSCDLVPSEHKWLYFIDTIQYLGGEDQRVSIRKNDILVGMNNIKDTIDVLKKNKDRTIVSYLRRPYGRPNRTPAGKRGWLYAERITVAIRMAAANPEVFDDVVMSNNPDLFIQIFGWSSELRSSARNEKERKGSIAHQLELFRAELGAMKFTFPSDEKIVNDIMTDLVERFRKNWKEETRRQNDMATRTREILLRWGEFSEQYVERAGFLIKEEESWSEVLGTLMRMLLLLVCPVFTLYLFWFDVSDDPADDSNVLGSVFVGVGMCVVAELIQSPLRLEFVGIPVGFHTTLSNAQAFVQLFFFSFVLRLIFGISPIPFEYLWVSVLAVAVGNKIIFGPKLISTTHPRTKEKMRVSLMP